MNLRSIANRLGNFLKGPRYEPSPTIDVRVGEHASMRRTTLLKLSAGREHPLTVRFNVGINRELSKPIDVAIVRGESEHVELEIAGKRYSVRDQQPIGYLPVDLRHGSEGLQVVLGGRFLDTVLFPEAPVASTASAFHDEASSAVAPDAGQRELVTAAAAKPLTLGNTE